MSTFEQPEIVSREDVVKMGGLLPLTDAEINSIAELVGVSPSEITRLPVYRVISSGDWTPSLKDFLAESMSRMPFAHTKAAMQGYLTLEKVEEYATGKFTMRNPVTGESEEFTLLYPYPNLSWRTQFAKILIH
ncbi:hypothetical protein [Rhizobium sp. C4]|uniref:hypothetical protein n=1 Tax=Rhizobium sp. C4 TaxID=1349800 RepID=UPI001E54F39B|nr:hypothetical protein [Rhizobium sp. C4]MCD2175344.1 hypothetical protein [Rhizobium sp. C4]